MPALVLRFHRHHHSPLPAHCGSCSAPRTSTPSRSRVPPRRRPHVAHAVPSGSRPSLAVRWWLPRLLSLLFVPAFLLGLVRLFDVVQAGVLAGGLALTTSNANDAASNAAAGEATGEEGLGTGLSDLSEEAITDGQDLTGGQDGDNEWLADATWSLLIGSAGVMLLRSWISCAGLQQAFVALNAWVESDAGHGAIKLLLGLPALLLLLLQATWLHALLPAAAAQRLQALAPYSTTIVKVAMMLNCTALLPYILGYGIIRRPLVLSIADYAVTLICTLTSALYMAQVWRKNGEALFQEQATPLLAQASTIAFARGVVDVVTLYLYLQRVNLVMRHGPMECFFFVLGPMFSMQFYWVLYAYCFQNPQKYLLDVTYIVLLVLTLQKVL